MFSHWIVSYSWDPIGCSPLPPQAPLSMGILQARKLDCVASSFSRGSFNKGVKPKSPALASTFFMDWSTGNLYITLLIIYIHTYMLPGESLWAEEHGGLYSPCGHSHTWLSHWAQHSIYIQHIYVYISLTKYNWGIRHINHIYIIWHL